MNHSSDGARRISPTDIAQFIRLEQCERYLSLRLHERAVGSRFLRDYGVAPQSIPPLLTRSGARFEQQIEHDVRRRFATQNCAADRIGDADDNQRVIAVARDLGPGATLVLFQARLDVEIAGWRMRGDVDILRLERDAAGALQVLIADMKSSSAAKVEHRLQVAFYQEMLATLLAQAGVSYAEITLAILYRGPLGATPDQSSATPNQSSATPDRSGAEAAQTEEAEQAAAAERLFGTQAGLLELVDDPQAYRDAVRDLVTGPQSTAERVAATPLDVLPYHLSYKCDGCLYNEYCMKWSALHDDLSLLPHLTAQEKGLLRRAGLTTTRALAVLKQPATESAPHQLVVAPGREALVQRLAATPPLGARLDELVQRARRYRRYAGDDLVALSSIQNTAYSSLPYCDATHNPNLVRVYIDAQHDYLHDRVYLLGALVIGCVDGAPDPARRRSVVHLTAGPPASAAQEEELFLRWIAATIQAIGEVAAPDEAGQPRAPIHLIFYDDFARRVLLEGLGRHAAAVLGATALYDFVTQLAAFDSPIASFLEHEVRTFKNYPMVCQSLQAVAAYLRFDWNSPEPYREVFHARLFDARGTLDAEEGAVAPQESPWYTRRARFNSQIPLEYAYAAWGELEPPPSRRRDDFAAYRGATPSLLVGFQALRLEAMERIAQDFEGNRQAEKGVFELPALGTFTQRAATLAQAIDEFVQIERHVELGDWKTGRLAPPERRVLAGHTLIVRYIEEDQEPESAATNRENAARLRLREQYGAEYRAAHPEAARVQLTKEQQAETRAQWDGLRLRLRLDTTDLACDLTEALSLSTLRPGDRVVLYRRTTVDSRLPPAEQTPFTPTPRQLLYGMRADVLGLHVERDGAGRTLGGYVEVALRVAHGGPWARGFAFGSIEQPLEPGERYTLDADPNNWTGYWSAKVTEGLIQGQPHTLYARLVAPGEARITWPDAAREGQARFLAGLDALHHCGALHAFEESKRAYIGSHGDDPTLLVQGPPGTGKSYATAFAIFARLQGALAAGQPYRVLISCKTHAAIDVLLENIHAVQQLLCDLHERHPEIVDRYIDPRLLAVPLFRIRPQGPVPAGVTALYRSEDRALGQPRSVDTLQAEQWCVAAATPGAIYGFIKEAWPNALFGHSLCQCLVLDEASQLNLPEALMAALPLADDGHLIVVGDHRQMPPIVKHNWVAEPRRTFQDFRTYESLFLTLLAQQPPLIQFAESFRLHAAMAAFLREEVYRHDGIPYYSRRRETLPRFVHADAFVAAVLAPEHPLVVVVHDEAESQLRNPLEQQLIAPVLKALSDVAAYHLDPVEGLGVVVPHRAQRALLQETVPCLTRVDPATGLETVSAVDTVERFQGGERGVIVVSATESDRDYLLVSGEFLLDPCRLTVALSRAKRKLILVASASVFTLFSADEETFARAQLWKNLLRRACTEQLWSDRRHGHRVTVWGNGGHGP